MALPYISEMQLFLAILVSAIGIISWLGLAALAHAQNRRTIPIRIHVAGSRGKTATTRLVGAALRSAGLRVLVKTTGTDPLLIDPTGEEQPWRRWGPPSISEQVRFFREARRRKVDAVVVESMAVEPEYIWASEHYLVRATHTVITNVRPDHAEVVGDEPLAAAQAISLVIPHGQRLVVSDEAAITPVLARAKERRCSVTTVPVAGLRHDAANRAMALAVCAMLEVAPETALLGFESAGEDPGAFFVARGEIDGRAFRFANAFSCNDPCSLAQLWRENPIDEEPVVLLNARHDRPERTRALLATLAALRPPPRLYISGFTPHRWVRAAGFSDRRVQRLRTSNARKVLSTLAAAAPIDGLIWGVGNYSRLGREIVRLLRREAVPC